MTISSLNELQEGIQETLRKITNKGKWEDKGIRGTRGLRHYVNPAFGLRAKISTNGGKKSILNRYLFLRLLDTVARDLREYFGEKDVRIDTPYPYVLARNGDGSLNRLNKDEYIKSAMERLEDLLLASCEVIEYAAQHSIKYVIRKILYEYKDVGDEIKITLNNKFKQYGGLEEFLNEVSSRLCGVLASNQETSIACYDLRSGNIIIKELESGGAEIFIVDQVISARVALNYFVEKVPEKDKEKLEQLIKTNLFEAVKFVETNYSELWKQHLQKIGHAPWPIILGYLKEAVESEWGEENTQGVLHVNQKIDELCNKYKDDLLTCREELKSYVNNALHALGKIMRLIIEVQAEYGPQNARERLYDAFNELKKNTKYVSP